MSEKTALIPVWLFFLRMSTDLSELLKEATKEVHEQAENTPFMRNFQKGQVSLQEFKVFHSSTARGWDFLASRIRWAVRGLKGEDGASTGKEDGDMMYQHLL